MKLTIKRITAGILFFAMFFGIIQYAGVIGRPYYEGSYNYNNWQYFYQEDDNTHNVINIGSSAIYRYWAPLLAYEEQGFTSFTIGSTRQPFRAVPYIMEEVMKTQNPDLIVVETRSLLNERIYTIDDHEYNHADMRSWVFGIIANGMRYSPTRFRMIRELYVDTEGDCELYWHIPLLKNHSLEYTLPLSERLDRIFPDKDPAKSTFLHSGLKILEDFNREKVLQEPYVLTDSDKAALDKVVETAKNCGVEVLFLSTPYSQSPENSSMQKSLQLYMEEKNYPFLDANDWLEEIGLNPEMDFYNDAHTNTLGAEKFTSYFANYIAEHYTLDNVTLTQSQTKEWDKAQEAYAESSARMRLHCEEKYAAALEAKAEGQLTSDENNPDS